MATSYKNPPKFDAEKTSYETWKNEVAIWRLVTDLPAEKQALAVSLSLSGQARESAMELPAADLNKRDGMDSLIAKLDAVFLKEDKDRAYEAYQNFDSYRKSNEIDMTDYIIEFERRYHRSRKYDMNLPDAVLAFKLLDNANLSLQERQLALTACTELKFASMKSALNRIFGDRKVKPIGTEAIQLKQETVYMAQQRRFNPRSQKGDSSSVPKGTNPINRYGKRTKCAICQSVFHWARDCPEKSAAVNTVMAETENEAESCNITLFTKEQASDYEVFVVESFGSAVIDTACTRTVCGEQWLNQYINELSRSDQETVTSSRSEKRFKFGDGNVVHSFQETVLPAHIGNTSCRIKTEVVKKDIPLLLSKASLKKAGAVLDLKNDQAMMFDQHIQLEFTSSGHYCVNLLKQNTEVTDQLEELEVLAITDDMSTGEKKKVVQKLHKQFGHASVDRLTRLLKSAGINDSETFLLLQQVVHDCDICTKHKRPSPRPVVGFPLASEYNDTVAVDLHELERGVWYLHIIDEFTRFSAGGIMRTKQASEFAKQFLENWICIHGAPRRIYSDNGGEFNNNEVRDMAENFSVEVKTTPAYSPWSNGLMERHNQTLTEILLKVKADNGCDWETALNWALMAKNALQNVQGYSPYQLVFGRMPNLPSVLTDKPPALEGTTMSTVVADHISALHSARVGFTQAECSERIRRALRKQIRPSGEKFDTGDKVYYKRHDCKEWKGPGTVIGQDGVVVFVRHGGSLIRVHQCRLSKVRDFDQANPEESANDDRVSKEADNVGVDTCTEQQNDDSSDNEEQLQNQNIHVHAHVQGVVGPTGSEERPNVDICLKPGQTVRYLHTQTGENCVAEVTGRAGKAKGINRNWYNLRYSAPDVMKGAVASVDLSKVQGFECVETAAVHERESPEENVLVLEDVSFTDAKSAELQSWKDNQVYTEKPDHGQKCISTRWICTLKEKPEGIVPKARLVARGFEELENEHIPKDSPTCASESLRLVLAVFAQNQWKPYSMDIKTAFLQGSELSRDIFIRPPQEANASRIVWQLRKCVYGLSDASLQWYNRVKEVLLSCGAEMSRVDPAVFYWMDAGRVQGILACHVDDLIWGGSKDFEKTVINTIRSTFSVGLEYGKENDTFTYVGIELSSIENGIQLKQQAYLDNLCPISLDKSRMLERQSALTEKELEAYRSKVGQILWVARQSRPDVKFDASNLAGSVKHATVQNVVDANKVIRKLKSQEVNLKFCFLGDENSLEMIIFSDASLGNLPDGGTQGGHFIMLKGGDGQFSPLSWQSRKICRVVRSTLAGEALALADGIDSGIFLATLFGELTTGQAKPELLPIICVTDNHSLWDAIRSTKCVTDKRLRLEISHIKELIQRQQIRQVQWLGTGAQLADCLTKKGASSFNLLKAMNNSTWHIGNPNE